MYYNIRVGIVGQYKKLLLVLGIVVLICVDVYHTSVETAKLLGVEATKFGLLDYYVQLMQGDAPAVLHSDIPYTLPAISVLLWILLSFCVGHFPINELQTQAENTVVRAKSRTAWWNGKVIWNVLMVVVYYSVVVVTLFLFVLVTNAADLFAFHPLFNQVLFMNEPVLNLQFWIAVFLVPVVAAVALTQIQMTISFVVGPFVSYIVMLAYFVCSAYLRSPLLIGNGLMLIRNDLFVSGACSSANLLLVSVFVWAIAYISGRLLFQRYPIIKKKEE